MTTQNTNRGAIRTRSGPAVSRHENHKAKVKKTWVQEMHESFFWSGIVSFLFIFAFDFSFVQKSLGTSLLLVRALNTGVCWFCFVAGSRKTLQMFSAFLKVFNAVKKGVDVSGGEIDEEPEGSPEVEVIEEAPEAEGSESVNSD